MEKGVEYESELSNIKKNTNVLGDCPESHVDLGIPPSTSDSSDLGYQKIDTRDYRLS